jgi:branched-chain amino acid transport system permease protein
MTFFQDLISVLLSGIMIGATYAAMSYGLGIIYGVMRVINLVHAGIITAAAYLAFWMFSSFRIDPIIASVVVMPFFFFLGIGIQKFFVARIYKGPQISSLLLLFAMWLVIKNIIYLIWTADDRSVLTSYTFKTMNVGIPVSYARLAVFLLAVIISVALYLFLQKTYMGKAIRAIAEDREVCLLVGIDVERISMVAFGIGSALAAMPGALMTIIYPINPEFGGKFLLKNFAVIILGGMGNMVGILLGGLIIGVTEAVSTLYIRSSMQDLVSFVILFLILLFRPSGILGVRTKS